MDDVILLANVYYNKALSLINCNDISNAISELNKSVTTYSKDIEALNLLGLCCYILCDFDTANFYWKKSVEQETKDNKAIAYLNSLKSQEFNDVLQDYNTALQKLNEQKIDEGIVIFEKITQEYFCLIEPLIILGLCYYQKGEHRKALEYWEKARDKDKGNTRLVEYINCVQGFINVKNKPLLAWKIGTLAGVFLLCTLLMLYMAYYSTQKEIKTQVYTINDYKKQISIAVEEKRQNDKEINSMSDKLETLNNENTNLKNQLQQILGANNTTTQVKVHNEVLTFNEAFKDYQNSNFKTAAEKFELIANCGVESYLVAESVYFSAVCFEYLEQFNKAIEYYRVYIDKYKLKNYYDDSLYKCGLLFYKSGQKEQAKDLLLKLVNEVPKSIYVNSKVRDILNK